MTGSRLTAGGPSFYGLRPDSDIGGEVYERMLLERLPAHGIDLVLGLPSDHCVSDPPPGWHVDVLRHTRSLHWTVAPATFVPYTMRLLRQHRVEILRGPSVRYSGPSLLLAKTVTRSRVPVVLHHHHIYPRWAQLEVAILRRADAVVTVSEFSKAQLVAHGVSPAHVHVIPEGVARPPTTAGWPEAWRAGGLRLLQLGRLEARKRPWLAIDALAVARSQGIEASLVVGGEGPLGQELATRAAAAGVGDAVAFVGRTSETDKWRLYDSADVLMFGSTLEGFGLVVAEAQSRGVAVIAAAGTATAEAIDPEQSGFLAAPTAEAFAACLTRLCDEERRRLMSARAVQFARRFDWDVCAAAVAEVYGAVAQGRS